MNSTVSTAQFERLFPFHFRTNDKGEVVFAAKSLNKLIGEISLPFLFASKFRFIRPANLKFSGQLQRLDGEAVILELTGTSAKLMGQVIYQSDTSEYLFVVNLSVQEPSEVVNLGLTFADFAIHDQLFDFLMLLQTHRRAIAEADQANQNLAEAHAVALRASQLKSQFLANMSHELRTPMNGVLGMASVLKDLDLTEMQLECVDTIIESGEGMLSLVNDILDLSKIEAGHVVLEKFPVDLFAVFSGVQQTLQLAADKKGISLTFDFDANFPSKVLGDETRIRQVLLNLVGNAVKFTMNGGVSVFAGFEKGPGSKLKFVVKDTGIGMSADTVKQLFQPFVQGDSSMSKKFGGTGLGLSICRKLVEAMGGECGVESEVGKGSIFTFTADLPMAPAPAGEK